LFHHDLLVSRGSGSGSGACLPSSLFFLVAGKKFCSIVISWFVLVPALVAALVSLLLLFFSVSGKGFCSATMAWFRFYFRFLFSIFHFMFQLRFRFLFVFFDSMVPVPVQLPVLVLFFMIELVSASW